MSGEVSVERARELILELGWNSTAYQIINPGISHWYAARGDALVGYARHAGVRVVAGAPVASLDRLGEVTLEFERAAKVAGDRVCYFGAEERLEELSRELLGHSRIVLGGQPVWQPSHLVGSIKGHASLRAQLNRARNKGVEVRQWAPGQVMRSAELRRVLHQWLDTRGLPPLHFMVEPETLSQPQDRMVFVAERSGAVVGFLVATPVPARQGWLVEQIVRAPGAPNGVSELLVAVAAEVMTEREAGYVTLGLSPLSRRAGIPDPGAPWWLTWILRWVRAHGRRFYNFDGLDAFKDKFRPGRWDPVFAISNRPRFSPRFLYAIAAAFSGGSPVVTVARAMGKAARQEWQWVRESAPLRA